MIKHKQWIAVILLIVSIGFLFRLVFIQPDVPASSEEIWVVYFASSEEVCLLPEARIGDASISERLQALINGPHDHSLNPIFPEGTQVISYQVEGNLILVNFNCALIDRHPGGSSAELITVYGLVNTLTEDPQIDYVQILVEGRTVPTIAGHVDVSQPLGRDETLIGAL